MYLPQADQATERITVGCPSCIASVGRCAEAGKARVRSRARVIRSRSEDMEQLVGEALRPRPACPGRPLFGDQTVQPPPLFALAQRGRARRDVAQPLLWLSNAARPRQ